MVIEILEFKDNNANDNGPILKENAISPRFLKLHACFIHHNFWKSIGNGFKMIRLSVLVHS